jgi:hypothetical protein
MSWITNISEFFTDLYCFFVGVREEMTEVTRELCSGGNDGGLGCYNNLVADESCNHHAPGKSTCDYCHPVETEEEEIDRILDEGGTYDPCWRIGCSHYRCEHIAGTFEAVYSAPGIQDPALPSSFTTDGSCWNAGCGCPGFMEEAELRTMIQSISGVTQNLPYEFEQIPGVVDVQTEVHVTIQVTTTLESDEKEVRDAVLTKQRIVGLANKDLPAGIKFLIAVEESEKV